MWLDCTPWFLKAAIKQLNNTLSHLRAPHWICHCNSCHQLQAAVCKHCSQEEECCYLSAPAFAVTVIDLLITCCCCRCPYYRTAEHDLYGTLTIQGNSDGYADTYWDALTTTTLNATQCGINLPGYPNKYKGAFMADPNNPTCGEWLQFTSQYPGEGPCYPVFVPTVDHLNRYNDFSFSQLRC